MPYPDDLPGCRPSTMRLEEALQMIRDVLLAYQMTDDRAKIRQRNRVNALCLNLCGKVPTDEQIREYIDSNYQEESA